MKPTQKGGRRRLGQILLEHGVLTKDRQVRLKTQGLLGDEPIGRVLVQLGWATHADVARALAEQAHREYVPPGELRPDLDAALSFPPGALHSLEALPLVGSRPHTFAVASPRDLERVAELEQLVGARVTIVVTDEPALAHHLSLVPRPDREDEEPCDEERRARGRTPIPEGVKCFYVFENQEEEDLYDKVFRGELQDASESGARIRGTLPRKDRERVVDPEVVFKCNIFLPEAPDQFPIRTLGQVRWAEPTMGFFSSFGVLWSPEREDDRTRLDGLVLRAFREATGRKSTEPPPRIVGERIMPQGDGIEAEEVSKPGKKPEPKKEKEKEEKKKEHKRPPFKDAWGGLVPP